MKKYKYYGNENFSVAWMEVFEDHVRVYKNCIKVF